MKNLKTFVQLNENAEPDAALKNLYSGIMNDSSIQRYTLGWSDVTGLIAKKLKSKAINKDVQFENSLLVKAISATEDKDLLNVIRAFARELSINMDTMNDKWKENNK